MKVAVAMSGGVDSSVAALLLRRQGYEPVGLTMRLRDAGPRLAEDAFRVADRLGMPHHELDLRREFEELVVADFVAEYARGRTPNPCVRCNQRVKFGVLLRRAEELGCRYLATGHHARIRKTDAGHRLLRGVDTAKDQSYFLYTMTPDRLARVLMPVGDHTKAEVRELAAGAGLPVARKPESQEICFVPGDDYVAFLKARRPELSAEDELRTAFRPGPVLDTSGRVLGEHDGVAAFTVGQRKGVGLPLGERYYVVRVDAARNAVILGTRDEARGRTARVEDVNWVAGGPPAASFTAQAMVRYRHAGARALVEVEPGGAVAVRFDEPQWAIAPGQSMVFYEGDVVLGGGTIAV